MNKPILSCIIVHYKSPELLRLCLKNMLNAVRDIDSEIIVIDSQAQSENEEIVDEFRGVYPPPLLSKLTNGFNPGYGPKSNGGIGIYYFPFKENLGYSRGVNKGIKKSSGEYLFITQPDVIVPEGQLDLMIDFLKKNPRVGLLGPKLLNFDGSLQKSYFRFYTPLIILYRRTFLNKFKFAHKRLDHFTYKDLAELVEPINVNWLMGGALMTKREAIKKVGLMDERFFMYFEDVDWARRFLQKGYHVVYFPKAFMYHWLMRESKSALGILDVILNKQTRLHLQSASRYFWKWANTNNE